MRDGARRLDGLVERAVARALEVFGDDVNVLVFGDHGTVECQHHVDGGATVRALPLRREREFVYFLDSTLVRVWGLRRGAVERLAQALTDLPGGRVLEGRDLARHRIRFPHRRHWDLVWLADAGTVIHRSFLNAVSPPPKGMHGYDPDTPENQALLLLDAAQGSPPTDIGTASCPDLFPTVLRLMGLPAPRPGRGRAIPLS